MTARIEGNRVLVDLRIPSKSEKKSYISKCVFGWGRGQDVTSAVVPEKMAMRPASEPSSTSGTQQNAAVSIK